MTATFQVDMVEFDRTMRQYQVMARRTMGEVIARQTRELGFYLYGAFKRIAPSRETITSAAKARGFAMAQPLSPKAYEFARETMGGQKTVWGSVTEHGGALMLRTIRIGRRGRRIKGGRQGRGGKAASYALGAIHARENEHPMNIQAVASFFELMLRRRGVKSLAVGWLPAIKQKVSPAEARSGVTKKLVLMQPKATLQWTGSMEIDTAGDESHSVLASNVPGLAKYPQVIARGIQAARQNMMEYIRRKLREALLGPRIT